MGIEDIEILVAEYLKSKDEELFNLIYKYYYPKFLKATKNDEDLVQECFITLIKALDTYNPKKTMKFNTWCWKLVKFKLTEIKIKDNAYKRLSNKNTVSLEEKVPNNNNYKQLTYGDTIAAGVITTDFNVDLNNAVNRLQDRRYKAIVKMLEDGETLTNIARTLNLSVPAVKRIIDKYKETMHYFLEVKEETMLSGQTTNKME